MLDLDDFKQVNDTHGHPAGDRMIKEIADVLRQRSRESDMPGPARRRRVRDRRCPAAAPTEARRWPTRSPTAIREHRPVGGDVDPITASVGVAMFGTDPRTSAESVVSEADTAMYAAKDGGRDGVRVFDRVAVRDDAAWDDLGL